MNSTPIAPTSPSPMEALIAQLAASSPALADLAPAEMETIAKSVIIDELKGEFRHRLQTARIDLGAKRQAFLERLASPHTRRAYGAALDALEAWSSRANIAVLDMKAAHADRFIASLKGSAASIRLTIAAASSFFSFLDRETEGLIRNPFLGSRLRPKRASAVPLVPTAEEVALLLACAPPDLQAAIIAILDQGFRVSALPCLQIWGARYRSESKGHLLAGTLAQGTLETIATAQLDPRSPWKAIGADSLRNRFRYLCTKLHQQGQLHAVYSIHDLRHYCAITHYMAHHNLYELKELLGHASVQVTEQYLRGLRSYLARAI